MLSSLKFQNVSVWLLRFNRRYPLPAVCGQVMTQVQLYSIKAAVKPSWFHKILKFGHDANHIGEIHCTVSGWNYTGNADK
jgi:hypothetical protein